MSAEKKWQDKTVKEHPFSLAKTCFELAQALSNCILTPPQAVRHTSCIKSVFSYLFCCVLCKAEKSLEDKALYTLCLTLQVTSTYLHDQVSLKDNSILITALHYNSFYVSGLPWHQSMLALTKKMHWVCYWSCYKISKDLFIKLDK